ncbi:MAG TPA: hypothetical protein VGD24_06565 [Gallionella sp.]
MYELLILAVLLTAVVLFIRGKPVKPLIIHRPGYYHLTLAPQLDHQQAFLEQIADDFRRAPPPQGDLPGQYYEVSAAQQPGGTIEAPYLLAVALRNGTLYFQAIVPLPSHSARESRLKAVREFSEAVLTQLPLADPVDISGAESLRTAVSKAAIQSGKLVRILD